MLDNELLSMDDGKSPIVEADATDVAKEYYTQYAKYVLEYRALPSISDGLKPVQRRIIYIANQQPLKLMKTAKLAGQVIAVHPHGTPSIEGAIYDMAHPLNVLPLFETKGNFGGVDFGPAASRYTECYLSEIARKNFCQFIDYADYEIGEIGEMEPVSLPSLIPYALFKGSQGIAVGLSTNIMPLNLIDLIEYYIDYIKNDGKSTLLVKPDVGAVVLNMDNKEIKDAVNKYSGRLEASSIITQLSSTTFLVEGVFNKSIDAVLTRLDRKYGWLKDNKVGFRDASTATMKYVFEVYDPNITTVQFREALEDATTYSGSYTRILEQDGTAIYANLSTVVQESLKCLNNAIDKKISTETVKIEEQILVFDILEQCKKAKLFDNISKISVDDLIKKIVQTTSCTIEIAKTIVHKPISFLTNSHDDEYQKLLSELSDLKSHDRKKYLLSLYREFKKLVSPIFNSKVHSISRNSLIKNPCLKQQGTQFFVTDGNGEKFTSDVFFISDKGYIYRKSLNPMSEAEIMVDTEYNDNIIGFLTDEYSYLTITTKPPYSGWVGKLSVDLSTVINTKKVLTLREGKDEETITDIQGYKKAPKYLKSRLSKTDWVKV